MNKRIRALIVEAGCAAPDIAERAQTLAELIVRECAIIANRAENNDNEFRCMYNVVTEHFGMQ